MKKIIFYIFILIELGAFAQQVDSLLIIDTIGFKIPKLKLLESNIQFSLDSVVLFSGSENLTDLLAENSSILVNQSGGKGGVGSLMIRGMSSGHTQVNWNGIPINSLTLGMFNTSLASTYSFDQLDVSIGASSGAFGNGAVAGVISLSNKVEYGKGWIFGLESERGSFGAEMYGGTLGYSGKKFVYKLKYNSEFTRNDFSFINNFKIGLPVETLEHAEFSLKSLNQSAGLKTKIGEFKWNSWWQSSNKNLPSRMSSLKTGTETLQDSVLRNVIEYKTQLKKYTIKAKYGNILSYLRYTNKENLSDENYSLDSRISTIQNFGFIDLKYKHSKRLQFLLSNNVQIANAKTINYSNSPTELRLYNNLLSIYKAKKWGVKTGLGLQSATNTKVTPIYFGDLDIDLSKSFKLLLNLARHYRVPTFNEKYWFPGGNINLLAESGYTTEIGHQLVIKRNRFNLKLKNKFYYMLVNNWIQWVDVGEFWQPINFKKVTSFGMEGQLLFNFKIRKVKFDLRSFYNLTKVSDSNNKNQFPLVPRFKISNKISIKYNGYALNYIHNYTSIRFTTTDNVEAYSLPSFSLSGVSLNKKVKYKKGSFLIGLKATNIFNVSYQIIESNAMPRRAYQLSIKYLYNSN